VGEILTGQIAISPYKQAKSSGCDFCPYRPVCFFDIQLSGNHYRRLPPLKGQDFWDTAARFLAASKEG
jgi:ATP-dependent helicase/nuclease subunit B